MDEDKDTIRGRPLIGAQKVHPRPRDFHPLDPKFFSKKFSGRKEYSFHYVSFRKFTLFVGIKIPIDPNEVQWKEGRFAASLNSESENQLDC